MCVHGVLIYAMCVLDTKLLWCSTLATKVSLDQASDQQYILWYSPVTVRFILSSDERPMMPTSSILMVAVHVYWSASEVRTGSRVIVWLGPDPKLDRV